MINSVHGLQRTQPQAAWRLRQGRVHVPHGGVWRRVSYGRAVGRTHSLCHCLADLGNFLWPFDKHRQIFLFQMIS